MVWGSVSNSKENDSVKHKRALINKAINEKKQQRMKKQSYHGAKKRLQLDDVVWASIGPQVDKRLSSGRRSSARKRLYGQILSSVNKNTYTVAFSDGREIEMSSRQLKKASAEEKSSYYDGVNTLIVDATRPHNDDDSGGDPMTFGCNQSSSRPCSSTSLKADESGIDQMTIDGHQSFDQCHDEFNNFLDSIENINHDQHTSFTKDNNKTQPSSSNINKNKTKINLSNTYCDNITLQQSHITSFTASSSNQNNSKKTAKPKTEQMYKDELEKARESIRRLQKENATYTVKSGKGESMVWTVIPEYLNLRPIPTRNEEFLGIRDLKLKERLANSALSLADLFLELSFKNGEWQRGLATMNRKISAHNDSLSSSRSSKGSGVRRAVHQFTGKEFLIGLALLIGAADCADKGENLWFTKSNKKWKKHWVSISPPANFGRYMKLYRFKQFRQFLPKIWEARRHSNNQQDPWWRFSGGIKTLNEIRNKLILPCEIIVIDESMSAYRPQTTKTGRLPNITYIFRKPEDLGTEFKSSVCPVLGVIVSCINNVSITNSIFQ